MDFDKGENRFYKEDDNGKLLAEITYKPMDENIVDADSTFVDESLRGQGIAEKLVERLAEEMKLEGKKIHPTCPYIVALFKRKPEKYGDIQAN